MTAAERKKHQANCRALIKALGTPRRLSRAETERRYREVMRDEAMRAQREEDQ